MGKLVDWDEEVGGNKDRSSGKINLMKIDNGKKHVFRPVGKPICYYRHALKVDGRWQRIIVDVVDDPEENILKIKYNIDVQLRFAMNVIDREDKQLKLYEFPPTVYNELKKFKKYSKKDPGGMEGSDIALTRKGMALNTKYDIEPLDPTPFTNEEKEMIKSSLYKLTDIFKSTPEDQIEKILGMETSTTDASVVDKVREDSVVNEGPVDNFDEDLGF